MSEPSAHKAPSDAILERLLALHPKSIDLSLGRIERLLAKLGNPERKLPPVIHVAGTNGKGSTCAYLRAGLEAAGRRVHVYISPHLTRFHERIRLAGELIEEEKLAALLEECERANGGEPITFFEITTAAAFLAFSREPADQVILEVGLGGRLDATNVVERPALTIVTPVSLDHQAYLGETLGAIAHEKAGILKKGAPGIVGPQESEALRAIEAQAMRVGAPLRLYERDWEAKAEAGRLIVEHRFGLFDLPLPALKGPHQIANAGGAVIALQAMGVTDPEHLAQAMTEVEWPGRLQKLRFGPLLGLAPRDAAVWLDGGHNPAAGQALADHLDEEALRGWPLPVDAICGMLDTKDAEGFFRPLRRRLRKIWTVAIPDEARAVSAENLAEAARRAGLDAEPAPSLEEAMRAIGREASPAGRVLICGSLHLAGVVLRDHS
ncbi:bifunctional folylpolyglutamate synthase/dihydrofolate synthase [Neomegalonema perideroedes]|uniref:bifunctional folylpolyglutamate synthase/dihydrofolate synthase n=1 Tax=Neomegalonema perideroedes TaxID=217219 RepID=UPI00036D61C3|nr:folylpolyglutamate synthase/dihydrofolate synthase family protein [Neomegalonema perideroedes]